MTARTRIRYTKQANSYTSNTFMCNRLYTIYVVLMRENNGVEASIMYNNLPLETAIYPNLTIAKRKIRKRLMTEYGVNLYEEIRGWKFTRSTTMIF